ncbi:NAD(P)H-binding protein [Streptomyces sp. NPDC046900]|uniref:NAD(P)H-binding protein n=1 Tax=Streptomyces sp. NPDC046900 TaxID=3155473 RepID=UPI003400F4C1
MARVFVLGATGGVGSRLIRRFAARGDDTVALHRRPSQAGQLAASGAMPVLGDLTKLDASTLAEQMRGCDAVVFAAGAPDQGPAAADTVDGTGLATAADAALAAGVPRFVHISAFPDAWRDRGMGADFEHYMKVKRRADVYLATTRLDWVIIRPGTLTNSPGTGTVRLGPAIDYDTVPRDDVAAVLAEAVHQPHLRRVILELTCGSTPVAQAVADAA